MIEGIWKVIYRELIADAVIKSLIGATKVATSVKRKQQGTKLNLVSNDGIIFDIPDVTRDSEYSPLQDNDIMISGISKSSDKKAVNLAKAAITVLDNKSFQTETDIIINQINWLRYANSVYFDEDIKAYRSDVIFQVLGSPK